MSVTYRIYTEDKNRKGIVDIVKTRFDGFTLFEGTGYWKGQPERSLIIEIITPCNSGDDKAIADIAADIKFINQQEAVFITKSSTHLIEI